MKIHLFIDFIVFDKVIIPEGCEESFLPSSFQSRVIYLFSFIL
uniref:Uncharacterized protein n=1 Tax=Anguilla anguilla TaxID=7936 RepID=A0A0E9WLD6_ANGAN